MQKAKVCIISKNKELARFFELELKNMDYDVAVRADIVAAETFDALVVDRDTVKGSIRYACPVLTVCADTADESGSLPWPTPVRSIRKQLSQLFEATADSGSAAESEAWDGRIYATGERTFLINGTDVELSKNEAAILIRLCRAKGEIVPREDIMELLGATAGNISDVYICLLRKKLEGQMNRRLIFTHRNKGYSTCLTIEE